MSMENNEKLAQLKQQKAEIAARIKELEETPDAKNKPIWFILIRILAIAMIGAFIANYKYGFAALGLFVLILIIGILDRAISQKKNSNRNQKIITLKAEESKLVALITSDNTKQH